MPYRMRSRLAEKHEHERKHGLLTILSSSLDPVLGLNTQSKPAVVMNSARLGPPMFGLTPQQIVPAAGSPGLAAGYGPTVQPRPYPDQPAAYPIPSPLQLLYPDQPEWPIESHLHLGISFARIWYEFDFAVFGLVSCPTHSTCRVMIGTQPCHGMATGGLVSPA